MRRGKGGGEIEREEAPSKYECGKGKDKSVWKRV